MIIVPVLGKSWSFCPSYGDGPGRVQAGPQPIYGIKYTSIQPISQEKFAYEKKFLRLSVLSIVFLLPRNYTDVQGSLMIKKGNVCCAGGMRPDVRLKK